MIEFFALTKQHLSLIKKLPEGWSTRECNLETVAEMMAILEFNPSLIKKYYNGIPNGIVERLTDFYEETKTALKICLCYNQFKTGLFIKCQHHDHNSWAAIR